LKVLGVDPGITATGYGIIENEACITTGTIRPGKKSVNDNILTICQKLEELIATHKPHYVSLEQAFYHKNVQSLIRSSELRGAIILTLLKTGMHIVQFTPTQVKLTTTGNGRASKQQVRYFVERIVLHSKKRLSSHATDAIAIAYTAMRKMNQPL
jgi:crossover junction endodeoxyribonuclease RuvC